MKINCLIVDDEQLARDMLEAYSRKISFLNIIEKCKNAAEASVFLKEKNIDLILLDINMPRMTGVDFLKNLNNPPMVIFTTAYSEYALEGYELEAVDYLLKPIGFDRFEKAVNKAKKLLLTAQKAETFEANQIFENQFLMVKDGYSHHKVFLKDILYIAAMKEYVRYHTTHGKIMELKSISVIEKMLPPEHFIRIHRSYIVAKAIAKGHEGNSLLLQNELRLPLGKTYKQVVLGKLFYR